MFPYLLLLCLIKSFVFEGWIRQEQGAKGGWASTCVCAQPIFILVRFCFDGSLKEKWKRLEHLCLQILTFILRDAFDAHKYTAAQKEQRTNRDMHMFRAQRSSLGITEHGEEVLSWKRITYLHVRSQPPLCLSSAHYNMRVCLFTLIYSKASIIKCSARSIKSFSLKIILRTTWEVSYPLFHVEPLNL